MNASVAQRWWSASTTLIPNRTEQEKSRKLVKSYKVCPTIESVLALEGSAKFFCPIIRLDLAFVE